MKRLFILFLTLCLLAAPAALAEVIVTPGAGVETIKAGNEITIDDVCTFTVKSVQEYDVFMGVESGAAQQFLVVSFDMLNWQTEPFYVRTQTSAELTYAEDFSFAPTYLWSDPGGTYYWNDSNNDYAIIQIYKVDDYGIIECNDEPLSSGYESIIVKADAKWSSLMKNRYVPETDTFVGIESDATLTCTDSSKTVLDPLVERTYHYVFAVPEIVARDEGLRVLTLNIGDAAYQMRF